MSTTNEAIRSVEAASIDVAEAIRELPDEPLTKNHFVPLRDTVDRYLQSIDSLNASLRVLGGEVEALAPYLDENFRPASERAIRMCQEALDFMDTDDASSDDYRRAISHVGLCIDRYATAVSDVTVEYGRISG